MSRFRFVDDHRDTYEVKRLCELVEVSRQGYYAWRSRPASPRAIADGELLEEIRTIHTESRCTYGAPRIHGQLRRRGHQIGCKRVARLMRNDGLMGVHKRKWRRRRPDIAPAPDRLNRDFRAGELRLHRRLLRQRRHGDHVVHPQARDRLDPRRDTEIGDHARDKIDAQRQHRQADAYAHSPDTSIRMRHSWRKTARQWNTAEIEATRRYDELAAPIQVQLNTDLVRAEMYLGHLEVQASARALWLDRHPELERRLVAIERELDPTPTIQERLQALELEPPSRSSGLELGLEL